MRRLGAPTMPHRARRCNAPPVRCATMAVVLAPTASTEPPAAAAIDPNRTLWLLSIAHAVNHAQAVLLPLVYIRIIGEFGVTAGTVALLAAAGAFASGAVQLSYAKLTRMISRRKILGAGGLLFGGGFAAQAIAPTFPSFAAVNVISRVGGSPQHPVGNGLLAEQFPEERRGFAISAHISGGNVGTVVVAVVGAPLIAAVRLAGGRRPVRDPGGRDRARDPGVRPRERRGPRGRGGQRQRPRLVPDGARGPGSPLGLPRLDPRRRRPRARRRQPVRAALPQPGPAAAAVDDRRHVRRADRVLACRCRSSPAGCRTGSGGSRSSSAATSAARSGSRSSCSPGRASPGCGSGSSSWACSRSPRARSSRRSSPTSRRRRSATRRSRCTSRWRSGSGRCGSRSTALIIGGFGEAVGLPIVFVLMAASFMLGGAGRAADPRAAPGRDAARAAGSAIAAAPAAIMPGLDTRAPRSGRGAAW